MLWMNVLWSDAHSLKCFGWMSFDAHSLECLMSKSSVVFYHCIHLTVMIYYMVQCYISIAGETAVGIRISNWLHLVIKLFPLVKLRMLFCLGFYSFLAVIIEALTMYHHVPWTMWRLCKTWLYKVIYVYSQYNKWPVISLIVKPQLSSNQNSRLNSCLNFISSDNWIET